MQAIGFQRDRVNDGLTRLLPLFEIANCCPQTNGSNLCTFWRREGILPGIHGSMFSQGVKASDNPLRTSKTVPEALNE
jgi:hypothetical protein